MTTSIAVIVGIDDYVSQPLTSACRDAVAFRDALRTLELVPDANIVLLTSPAQPNSRLADLSAIVGALHEVYDRGASLDRFFFYFAGHGLTAWTGASKSAVGTAVVPREVVNLAIQANLLINVDDLRARMERAGPAEQYFFVDACRNLVFDNQSIDLPGLGWLASAEPRSEPAAQAALFAVSPGGHALGEPEGLGVMSRHLVDALHGRGLALDWSDDEDAWIVTSESIAAHVRQAVAATLSGHPFWKQRYMIPDLRPTGPPLTPLRIVVAPPRPTLQLEFVPPEIAGRTVVRLKLRGQLLQQPCWPPHQPGEAVALDPQVYRIDVEALPGRARADPAKIDLRLVGTATIRGGMILREPRRPEPGPGAALVDVVTGPGSGSGRARVRAVADEASAVIELAQLAPPYRRWEAAAGVAPPWIEPTEKDVWQPRGPRLDEEVAPGSYALRFRLGTDIYSQADLELLGGQTVDVAPRAEVSAALVEAVAPEFDGSVLLSESIGPLRSSPLLTALPIVGVIPFDTTGELFDRFRASLPSVVDTVAIAAYGGSAVRVVVAVDGHGWPMPPAVVASGVTCEITGGAGPVTMLPLHQLAPGTRGWARLMHGTLSAPSPSFTVRIRSPIFGEIDLAAAALPNRITVVGLVVNPDGRLDVVQHLLRVPGLLYPDELEPGISYGRMLRELVLGQRLYESDDLITHGAVPNAQVLRDLLFAKWTDPILGCMAYYAWNDAVERGLPEAQGVAPSDTGLTARRLYTHFPGLPDARIIAARAGFAGPGVDPVLPPGDVPVLARSLREAVRLSPGSAELAGWSSAVAPRSPWTQTWRLPGTTRPHPPMMEE